MSVIDIIVLDLQYLFSVFVGPCIAGFLAIALFGGIVEAIIHLLPRLKPVVRVQRKYEE